MKHQTGERWMPNSKESQYLVEQLILANSFISRAKALEERAKAAGPTVWRDIRCAAALVEKSTEALMKTVPASKLEWFAKTLREGHIRVDMPGPVRRDGYVVISDRDAAALTEAAMRTECAMCTRTGSDVRSCPIRRALLVCAAPDIVEDEGMLSGCEYERYATQLISGEEVWMG